MNPTLKRGLLTIAVALAIILSVYAVAYLFTVNEAFSLIGLAMLIAVLFFYLQRTIFRLSFLDTPEHAETRKDYTRRAIIRLAFVLVIGFFLTTSLGDMDHLIPGLNKLSVVTLPSEYSFLIRYLFWFCLAFVVFLLQYTLRQRVFRVLNWKKLGDPWLKWTGVPALSVGGMGFVSSNQGISDKLFNTIMKNPNVNINFLIGTYCITILILGLSFLLTQIGRTQSANEDTYQPLSWFVPAFLLAWIANVLLFTLLFVAIILTIYSHVKTQ